MNIGIDLGTFNSAAAVVVGRQIIMVEPSVAQYDVHSKNFPSFVLFDKRGKKQQVGVLAKGNQKSNPKSVIWGVKRLVGISFDKAKEDGEFKRFMYDVEKADDGGILIKVGAEKYTPSDILQFILEEIKANAEDKEINKSLHGKIEKTVVSVPAYFDQIRTKLITDAAKAAGLDNVETIAEPTAATLAYVHSPIWGPKLARKKENRILTFDIGAGTLDVTTMLVVKDGNNLIPSERFTAGDTALGGINIDQIFTNYLIDRYKLDAIYSDLCALLAFKEEVEKIKIALSNQTTCTLSLPNLQTVNVTQMELERELNRPIYKEGSLFREGSFLDKCLSQVKLALKLIKWDASDLDHVLFVGGPSFTPCIRSAVINELKAEGARQDVLDELVAFREHLPVNPMECVAQGAALKASGSTLGPRNVPFGYGTVLGHKYYYQVIPPNSYCPISFPTKEDPLVLTFLGKEQFVSIPLIKKIAYEQDDKIMFKYEHSGDFDYYPQQEGLGTHVDIVMELTRGGDLKINLTQLILNESDGSTTKLETRNFGGLDKFSGEEVYLSEYSSEVQKQENNKISDILKQIMEIPPSKWTEERLERAIHVARNIIDDASDFNENSVNTLKTKLNHRLSHKLRPQEGPDVMNDMLELLNALFVSGKIDKASYIKRQSEFRQIIKG